MSKWDTVAIIGVGLLGGSIGLALQQRNLARQVIGVGRRESSLRRARQHGVVTSTTTNLGQGVADAELVVVCTPVADIVPRVLAVAKHCPAGSTITDVGSTKSDIVRQLAGQLPPATSFVGSHPLAGSEKTGPEHAVASLLEDRLTVVTPTQSMEGHEAVDRVEAFWQSLGSRVMRMSPESHDRAVAMTSHVPHVLASVLAAATPHETLPLVAGGWRDTTRIAAGDPQLWLQILLSNRDEILHSLDKVQQVMSQLRAALESGDRDSIIQLLDAGKNTRDSVGS